MIKHNKLIIIIACYVSLLQPHTIAFWSSADQSSAVGLYLLALSFCTRLCVFGKENHSHGLELGLALSCFLHWVTHMLSILCIDCRFVWGFGKIQILLFDHTLINVRFAAIYFYKFFYVHGCPPSS